MSPRIRSSPTPGRCAWLASWFLERTVSSGPAQGLLWSARALVAPPSTIASAMATVVLWFMSVFPLWPGADALPPINEAMIICQSIKMVLPPVGGDLPQAVPPRDSPPLPESDMRGGPVKPGTDVGCHDVQDPAKTHFQTRRKKRMPLINRRRARHQIPGAGGCLHGGCLEFRPFSRSRTSASVRSVSCRIRSRMYSPTFSRVRNAHEIWRCHHPEHPAPTGAARLDVVAHVHFVGLPVVHYGQHAFGYRANKPSIP